MTHLSRLEECLAAPIFGRCASTGDPVLDSAINMFADSIWGLIEETASPLPRVRSRARAEAKRICGPNLLRMISDEIGVEL